MPEPNVLARDARIFESSPSSYALKSFADHRCFHCHSPRDSQRICIIVSGKILEELATAGSDLTEEKILFQTRTGRNINRKDFLHDY